MTGPGQGPGQKHIRIFLSSPSDVGPERNRAEQVTRALQEELGERATLRLFDDADIRSMCSNARAVRMRTCCARWWVFWRTGLRGSARLQPEDRAASYSKSSDSAPKRLNGSFAASNPELPVQAPGAGIRPCH